MTRTWLITLVLLAAQSAMAPVIDGEIGQQEWAGARRARMNGGGEVQFLPRGEYLFVSVRGPRTGLASLCVAKGKTVRILHASAAIGDATFERWGDMWMKRKDFEWTLRVTSRAGRSEEAKEDWLARNGWIANSSTPGSTVREFKILAKTVEFIGVTFLGTGEPMTVSYWPSTMSDDCRSLKIPMGYLPDTARFDPHSWHKFHSN
jgi:hypothetical protein